MICAKEVGLGGALSDPMAIPPLPCVVMFRTVILEEGRPILMPVMAAGTAGYKSSAAKESVDRALAAGFAHVHTAYDYYNLKEALTDESHLRYVNK